jgi:hypothetical protein
VKGTGAASTSAPSVLSIASANINSNPMTQPAIITTTTIEDRNASTKLLDISHQTPETRDISSSQPVPSNTSVLGPGISNPLPFPAIATASPKHTSAANMVTTEESAAAGSAVGTSSGNPNSTESGSNNTVTTEMTTAKKKISRFIVKSVPKEVLAVRIFLLSFRLSDVSNRRTRVGCQTHLSGRSSLLLRVL